VKNTEGVL